MPVVLPPPATTLLPVTDTSTTTSVPGSTTTTASLTTSSIITTTTTPIIPPPSTSSLSSSEVTSTTTSAPSLTSSSTTTPNPPTPTSSSTTFNPSTVRITSSGTGGIVTVTSIIESTPTNSIIPTQSGSNTPKSFFQNTAAVAGVFTVVGLIGIALLFVCVTNAVRRRRAQQFDRDVAEAAAAAADAQPPVFDDDDNAYGSGGNFTRYSDNSHGTYGQPPMTHNGGGVESYGMSEIHPYDPFATGAGAAGVGVGAAMQRARSRKEIRPDGMAGYDMYDVGGGVGPGYGEHSSPYPVFSGPPAQQHPAMYDSPPGGRYATSGSPGFDLLDAAGLGATGAAHVTRDPSVHKQQIGYSDLSRNKSQGTRNVGTDGYYGTGSSNGQDPVAGESYAAHYQPGYQPPPRMHSDGDVGGEDAYGGYIGPQQQLPPHGNANLNPQLPRGPAGQEGSGSDLSDGEQEPDGSGGGKHVVGDYGSQASLRDEEDYELERGKRVLKVANE